MVMHLDFSSHSDLDTLFAQARCAPVEVRERPIERPPIAIARVFPSPTRFRS
jgi:hypothetical protein